MEMTRNQLWLAVRAVGMNLTDSAKALGVGRQTLHLVTTYDRHFDVAKPETFERIKAGLDYLGIELLDNGGVRVIENPGKEQGL